MTTPGSPSRPDTEAAQRVLLPECRHSERPFQWADYPCCSHCGNPHIERADGRTGHSMPCGQFDCDKGKMPFWAVSGNAEQRVSGACESEHDGGAA